MRSTSPHRPAALASLLLAVLLANFATHAGEAPQPIPDEKALKEALALVKELHAADYKKAEDNAEATVALARTLRGQAAETNDDPAGRYVLNQEALHLFAKQGMLAEMEQLLKKQDDLYEFDLIAAAEGLFEEALRNASKDKKDDLKDLAKARLGYWRARRPAYEAAGAAYRTLKADPSDPTACLVLGLYRCLDEDKWEEGLALLQRSPKGGKEAEMAAVDLAALEDESLRAKAGELWWDYSRDLDKKSDRFASAQRRAAYWYSKALPFLKGLTKDKVEKRLEEFAKDEEKRLRMDDGNVALLLGGKLDKIKKEGWLVYKFSKAYLLHRAPMTWADAQKWAQSHGGTLASIRSQEEELFINQLFKSSGLPDEAYYLGGTDKGHEGTWVWLDNSPWTYSNWDPHEPNNSGGSEDYLSVWTRPNAGKDPMVWNDANGGRSYPFVVQWTADSIARIPTAIDESGLPITSDKPKADRLAALLEPPGAEALEVREVAQAYKDSVAVLKNDSGTCTGFWVDGKGYLLTCAHGLSQSGAFTVLYKAAPKAPAGSAGEEKTLTSQKIAVVSVNRALDLALLKVDTEGPVTPVRLASEKCEMGQKVSIIGNPGMKGHVLEQTLTAGVVSSPARDIEGLSYIQTDASVNPGNSGSPIFDEKGNVIGMIVFKAFMEGVGFGIPMSRIKTFLQEACEP